MIKIYDDLLEIYRMGIIELNEITYEDAEIDCANKIVYLDNAHANGEIGDFEYKKARANYEKAYAVLGAKIIEGTALLNGYRIDDSHLYITSDGAAIAPLDCDRYQQYIDAAKELKAEAAQRKAELERGYGSKEA